jgi:hypothetical protein
MTESQNKPPSAKPLSRVHRVVARTAAGALLAGGAAAYQANSVKPDPFEAALREPQPLPTQGAGMPAQAAAAPLPLADATPAAAPVDDVQPPALVTKPNWLQTQAAKLPGTADLVGSPEQEVPKVAMVLDVAKNHRNEYIAGAAVIGGLLGAGGPVAWRRMRERSAAGQTKAETEKQRREEAASATPLPPHA